MKIALVPLLLALALAGCGGPSEQEKYVQGVNKAVEQFGTGLLDTSARMTPSTSLEEDQLVLREHAEEVRALNTDLGKLTVPEGARTGHAELRSELAAFAQQLENTKPEDAGQVVKLTVARVRATVKSINGSL